MSGFGGAIDCIDVLFNVGIEIRDPEVAPYARYAPE